ncbi:MAG: ABC transporter ATP-binding protein [Prochlorotrichaceae cyanobacterium]|jgi:ATP-binding cassette subfamily B protein
MANLPLLRLFDYTTSHRTQVYQAITCSILNKIFDLAPPVLIGMAVDVVVQQEDSWIASWGFTTIASQLGILSVLTLLIWTGESVFQYAYDRLWRSLAQLTQHELRLDAYSHLQELEMGFFEERSTGQLLAVLNDDINQLERFLDRGANEILQVTTTVIIVGGAFFLLAPGVAWMAMLPMPFIVWGSFWFQGHLAPRYSDVRDKAGYINMRLANNLTGMATIKSFTAEAYERERVEVDSEAYRRSNAKAIALSAAFIPLIRVFILVGFTATLFFGGLATVEGQMAVGTYSVLVFITQRLLWPLTRLGETLDQYQRAMASTQRVLNLLATPITIRTGARSLPVETVQGSVSFENITFAYPGRQPALKNLSLKVLPGETIGVVGATGSGKSTLVKLLLRFYEVQEGEIRIDGLEIRDLKLRDLRHCIAWVSQDVFLFHGTVAENIAYGSFDASQSEIQHAAELAEAHEFIQQLPQGYNTIVGERGQKLSGGQRQRLAIARAILKNPPILILDEATSAVDNETEAAIQRSLQHITQDRTTIAIAHRLSTIRHAHRIYVMEEGQVVEEGQHEQLLALQGVYANLWNIQSGERNLIAGRT